MCGCGFVVDLVGSGRFMAGLVFKGLFQPKMFGVGLGVVVLYVFSKEVPNSPRS